MQKGKESFSRNDTNASLALPELAKELLELMSAFDNRKKRNIHVDVERAFEKALPTCLLSEVPRRAPLTRRYKSAPFMRKKKPPLRSTRLKTYPIDIDYKTTMRRTIESNSNTSEDDDEISLFEYEPALMLAIVTTNQRDHTQDPSTREKLQKKCSD
jgi:hypothetical protein